MQPHALSTSSRQPGPARKRPVATAGELLLILIALTVPTVVVGNMLREPQPLIAGLVIGLYIWASFLILRAIYRSPDGEPDRRFGR